MWEQKVNEPLITRSSCAACTREKCQARHGYQVELVRGRRWFWAAFLPVAFIRYGQALLVKSAFGQVRLRPRARVNSCSAAANLDDLTMEEYCLRLSEVRAHYRQTGEISQDRVCMNMLATRCSDLHLDRCHTGASKLPDAGIGLFASRDIRAGELITLYPGDALLYWKDGRKQSSSRICSGVVFGAHIPEDQRDPLRVTSESSRQYEVGASTTLSCVGDPRLDDCPAYLGHFANDGSVCDSVERIGEYLEETGAAANADHVTLEGCQLGTQATRDIASGEEILVTYGEGYWLSHLLGVDSVPTRVSKTDGAPSLLNCPPAEPPGGTTTAEPPTNATLTKKKKKGGGKRSKEKGKAARRRTVTGFGRAGRPECVTGGPASSARFTRDVCAASGLCCDGRVRIGVSPGKGLGAFAVHALSPTVASNGEGLVRGENQIGEYRGEVYTLEGMQKRYGKGGKIAAGCVEWHKEWSDRRQARGVGITGRYVFTIADALDPWSEVLYVDAEDPAHAVWTRYINHSERPNLAMRSSNGLSDSRTTLRLVVSRQIEAGEELLIDYGPRYEFEEQPVKN